MQLRKYISMLLHFPGIKSMESESLAHSEAEKKLAYSLPGNPRVGWDGSQVAISSAVCSQEGTAGE